MKEGNEFTVIRDEKGRRAVLPNGGRYRYVCPHCGIAMYYSKKPRFKRCPYCFRLGLKKG